MAQGFFDSRNIETQWPGPAVYQNYPTFANIMNGNISPQSSLESIDHNNEVMVVQETQSRDDDHYHDVSFQQIYNNKKRPFPSDLGELEELAVRMMRN